MPVYRLSRAADNDIASIAAYTIDSFGIEQAVAYREGLVQAFEFLLKFPRVARKREELRQKPRVYAYKSHLIFYRIDGEDIFILRIRHAREDWLAEPEQQ